MRALLLIAGSVATLALVIAMVQSMLITRNSRNWINFLVGALIGFFARLPLRLIPSYRGRDKWLSFMAPATLLIQLVVYATLFILSLGVMVWGSTTLSWGDALYQAGSTFTTLGIVEPVNAASAVITFFAAFLGLIVVAIFIGYLMAIYSMYANREAVMARIATFAGEPAWGPEIIARAHRIGKPVAHEPDAHMMLDWVSQLRLNQEMNPVLAEFRSTTAHRHWLVTLVATLDAVSLRLAMKLSTDIPSDLQLLTEGALTLGIFDGITHANWEVEQSLLRALEDPQGVRPSLTDEEWELGWQQMLVVGVTSTLTAAEVRTRFDALRASYIDHVLSLAVRYHAVRAPWTGQRVPETPVLMPMLAGQAV
jgi:hypothetical protein